MKKDKYKGKWRERVMFMFFNDLIARALCVKAEMELSSLSRMCKRYNEEMKEREARKQEKVKSERYRFKMDNTTKEFFDFLSKITEFDEKKLNKETIMKNDFFNQLYDSCKEDKQEQVIQYLSKLAELISYMKKDIEDDLDEEDIEVMREMIPEWIKAVQAVRECLVM